jgi:DNA-binding protein HU-beta
MTAKTTIATVADLAGLSQAKARAAIAALEDHIAFSVSGGHEAIIPGIGKFVAVDRKARNARNPSTDEIIRVPAKRVIKFKPCAALKRAIEGKS